MLYLFIFEHHEWQRRYNCSIINVDSVPLEQRQSHNVAAWATIILCAFFYSLYIPCMQSLWKHLKRDGKNACYNLLFYMGCMDNGNLFVLGFLHGYLALEGAVFCTRPLLIYFTGIAATVQWMCLSSADMLLAINRCMDILCPMLTKKIFDGFRIRIWLSLINLYGLYWMFLANPALFNSLYFAYFFNPYIGYIDSLNKEYTPLVHTIHDWGVGISLPLVYVVFFLFLKWKMRGAAESSGLNRIQFMSFMQVFLISSRHIVGDSLYGLLQFVPMPPGYIELAQFSWFFIHGTPPLIYLALNPTIRSDCIILYNRIFRPSRVFKIHGITAIRNTLAARSIAPLTNFSPAEPRNRTTPN